MEQSGSDLEDLRASEEGGGKLRVSGRLAGCRDCVTPFPYSISRVEDVEYVGGDGEAEIVVHVYVRDAQEGGRDQVLTFDHTLDLAGRVKRVFVGGFGEDGLVWGAPEEPAEDRLGIEDKLAPVELEYLWEGSRGKQRDPSSREWMDDWRLGAEIRRIHLGKSGPGDGILDPYRTEISEDHPIYKDRISGKIRAMKFRFRDGASIIVDKEADASLMGGVNLIVCEPGGEMRLCGFRRVGCGVPGPH